MCADEPFSAENIITFLRNQLLFGNEKEEHASNPIPYPEEEYLSGSIFLVNWTALKKQFIVAKSLVCEYDQNYSSEAIWSLSSID